MCKGGGRRVGGKEWLTKGRISGNIGSKRGGEDRVERSYKMKRVRLVEVDKQVISTKEGIEVMMYDDGDIGKLGIREGCRINFREENDRSIEGIFGKGSKVIKR